MKHFTAIFSKKSSSPMKSTKYFTLMLIRQHKQPTIRATYRTHKKWPGSKEVNKLQLPCDFEDSWLPNSSSFRIGKYIIPGDAPLIAPPRTRRDFVKGLKKNQRRWKIAKTQVGNPTASNLSKTRRGAKAFQPPTCQFFHLGDYWRFLGAKLFAGTGIC